jgi:hypothetical protein
MPGPDAAAPGADGRPGPGRDGSGADAPPPDDPFDGHGWGDHDPVACEECGPGIEDLGLGGGDPDPDLGEIVVILLVSTLAGLRDRLERDGFESAAALVHDLVEVADDYVMRFQP